MTIYLNKKTHTQRNREESGLDSELSRERSLQPSLTVRVEGGPGLFKGVLSQSYVHCTHSIINLTKRFLDYNVEQKSNSSYMHFS